MMKLLFALFISITLLAGSAIAAGERHVSAKLTIFLAGVSKPVAEYTNVYDTLENGCIHILDRLGPGAHMTTYSLGAFGFKSERE